MYKDRFGTPIKFVNISFGYKHYYKYCWKFYKSWKKPVHHDINEFRCTSRPWTVENHYKIEIRGGGGGVLKFKRWWIANTIAMKLKDLNLKRLVKIEQYVSTCISVYMYFGIHAQSARVRVTCTCMRCTEEKNFVGSSCPLIFWLFRHLENFLLEKNH